MLRRWSIAALGAAAFALALAVYHLLVMAHGEEHYRLLLEGRTVDEKRRQYDEILRWPHPWNPWCRKAEEWYRENGHEWEFFRMDRRDGRDQGKAAGRPGTGKERT